MGGEAAEQADVALWLRTAYAARDRRLWDSQRNESALNRATMHYAHSTNQPDRTDWQVLDVHLTNVAELAAAFGAVFGAGKAARLAGLLPHMFRHAG